MPGYLCIVEWYLCRGEPTEYGWSANPIKRSASASPFPKSSMPCFDLKGGVDLVCYDTHVLLCRWWGLWQSKHCCFPRIELWGSWWLNLPVESDFVPEECRLGSSRVILQVITRTCGSCFQHSGSSEEWRRELSSSLQTLALGECWKDVIWK